MLMIRCSSLILTAALLLTVFVRPAAAAESVSFLGETYTESSESTAGGSSIHEFTRPGEDLNNWTRLLTVQCHPAATRIGDAVNPYLAGRRELFLAKPMFIRSPADGDAGLALVATMGQKNSPTFEFVVARFFLRAPGVIVVALSERHKIAKEVALPDGKKIESAVLGFEAERAREVCSDANRQSGP